MSEEPLKSDHELWRRTLLVTMLVLFVCTVGAAYFNYGFFHPDEYFQIIEFASSKMGITDPHDLPWEYGAKIRPWLQPALCYVLFKGMAAVGIEDRFAMTFVLRLLFGLFGCVAVGATTLLAIRWASHQNQRWFQALLIPTLCYSPFLLTRTSSESLSLSLFMLAVALLMWRGQPAQRQGCQVSIKNAIVAGLLLGLSFEVRYQTAALTLGLVAWMLLISRTRILAVLVLGAGIMLSIVVCVFIDNWGYGESCIPFVNYFMQNIVAGKAEHYGSSPWYAYFYLVLLNPAPWVGLLLLFLMLLFWYRQPRHLWTWVTIPFFVIHSVIGHKEDRFLIPMLLIMAAMMVPALDPREGKPFPLLEKMIRQQHRWVFWPLYAFNGIGLLLISFYPFTVNSHFFLQRYIYENRAVKSEYYKTDFDPYVRWGLKYTFYRPEQLEIKEVSSLSEMEQVVESSGSTIYFVSGLPFIEGISKQLERRSKRIISDCLLFCINETLEEKLRPITQAIHNLSPENLLWGSIFEIRPDEIFSSSIN